MTEESTHKKWSIYIENITWIWDIFPYSEKHVRWISDLTHNYQVAIYRFIYFPSVVSCTPLLSLTRAQWGQTPPPDVYNKIFFSIVLFYKYYILISTWALDIDTFNFNIIGRFVSIKVENLHPGNITRLIFLHSIAAGVINLPFNWQSLK